MLLCLTQVDHNFTHCINDCINDPLYQLSMYTIRHTPYIWQLYLTNDQTFTNPVMFFVCISMIVPLCSLSKLYNKTLMVSAFEFSRFILVSELSFATIMTFSCNHTVKKQLVCWVIFTVTVLVLQQYVG